MNAKKSNWIFLIVIMLYIGVTNLLGSVGALDLMPDEMVTFLPEFLIIVPSMCFLLFQKEPLNLTLGFHRIRFTNLLLLIVYVALLYPAIICVNSLSMIFVENVVV